MLAQMFVILTPLVFVLGVAVLVITTMIDWRGLMRGWYPQHLLALSIVVVVFAILSILLSITLFIGAIARSHR